MQIVTKNIKKGKSFGLLIVKNKIAAYESGTKINFALSTGDILKVLAVCNSKFKQVDDIDTGEVSSAVDAMELSWSDDSDVTSSNSFSPIRLPRSATIPKRKASMKPRLQRHLYDPAKSSSLPRAGFSVLAKVRFEEETLKSYHSEDAICDDVDDNDSRDDPQLKIHPSMRVRRQTMSDFRISEEAGNTTLSHEDIHSMTVFMKSAECQHTPFMMHSMKISESVNFVLLTEVKHVDIAAIICKFISLLKNIQFKPDASPDATKGKLILMIKGGLKTYEKIADCCKDLKSKLRNVPNDRQVRRILGTWEKTISKTLRDFLSQKRIGYLDKLERNISELSLMLQNLFQQIFLMKPRSKTNWKEKLTAATLELKRNLDDHLEFYKAKAARNLSVNRNYENYPGLLHFLHVRRWKRVAGVVSTGGPMLLDEVHTSGLHIPGESEVNDDRLQLKLYLKKQVSRSILRAYAKVEGQEGVSRYSFVEGDFKGTSFFWTKSIESVSFPLGHSNSVNSLIGSASLCGFESPFYGVKGSDKAEGKLLLLELHLVHFSTVPDYMVVKHANKVLEDFKFNKYEV